MKIEEVRTSREATSEVEARRAELATLDDETNDATWLATEPRRNELAREIRSLDQLRVRIAAREEEERRADIIAKIEVQKEIAATADGGAELETFMRETTATLVPRLRASYAVLRQKNEACNAIGRLQRELGERDEARGVAPLPFTYRALFTRLQNAVYAELVKLDALDMLEDVRTVFTPEAPLDPSVRFWRPDLTPLEAERLHDLASKRTRNIVETPELAK